jgi:hypothetical protein
MDHVVEHGLTDLRQGQRTLATAQALVQATGPTMPTEQLARSALATLRSAMDWLEDTPEFDAAHHALDEAGAFIRRTFGCELHRDGTSYSVTCPVALAHNRSGFSPSFIILEQECSICGKDPEDCPHIRGREYHGQTCYHIITKAKLLHIAIVSRPANPSARIMSISVSHSELRKRCGTAFRPGMPVSCDRCLSPCRGIVEISKEGPGRSRLVMPRRRRSQEEKTRR